MANHQELLKLSQDIEVLKNAGCIKAASILHKKFIKESQAVQTQDGQMKSQSGGGNPYTQPPGTTYILGPGGTQVVRPEDLVSPYPVQTPPPTPALPPLPPGYNPGDYSYQDPKTGRTIYLDPRTGQPFEGGLSQGYGGNPGTYSSGPGGGYVTVPQPVYPPGTIAPPTQPPANTVPPPGPYQNPGGDTQRGYGNQQSQDQELQYLMNEKKRLEEMGANDPNSNLYQQYQTILEMIKRNQGGSAIRKSKNMNKFEKLAKLNKDIEVLENAGKLQAANVLHKKFVKEAQAKSANDLMREIFMLAQNPGPDFDNLVKLVNRNLNSSPAYNEDEIEAIKRSIEKAQKQRQNIGAFSTTVAPPNQTLAPAQTAVPTTAPARKPYIGNTNLAKSPGLSIGPMDDPLFPPVTTSTQAPSGQTDNFKNYYTEQSDTANYYQQQNSNPNAQQESNEQRIYMNALNDIILAFSQRDRNTGEAIFNKTLQQITNPTRKKAFLDQIQRQRTKYFAGKYNQGPTK